MITYTLNAPFSTGTFERPQTITTIQIASVRVSTTPVTRPLPFGSAELDIVVIDQSPAANGWSQMFSYEDPSIVDWWNSVQSTSAEGTTVKDIVDNAVFTKLIADGKLPAGTVTNS